MAVTNDCREFLDKMLSLVQSPEARTASAGMKTTNVPGFPLFLTWGVGVVLRQISRATLRLFYFCLTFRPVRCRQGERI
jgi:hypothetical protein